MHASEFSIVRQVSEVYAKYSGYTALCMLVACVVWLYIVNDCLPVALPTTKPGAVP